MSHELDPTRRLETCDKPPGTRSAFCSLAHRLEHRRVTNGDRNRPERGTPTSLDAFVAPESGRSMAQGPYGGYNHAGTPALFQVRRVSR